MRPIFNEKVAEKCNLWVHKQCMEALFIEDLVNNCGLEKKKKRKKKKENAERKNVDTANAQSKHILYMYKILVLQTGGQYNL